MATDLKTNQFDLVRVDGKTLTTDSRDEIRQSLQNRLSTRLGEFFVDTTYGLEFENLLSYDQKRISKESQELAIRECVLDDDRIELVESIEIIQNGKATTINFVAKIKDDIIEGGVIIA